MTGFDFEAVMNPGRPEMGTRFSGPNATTANVAKIDFLGTALVAA